MKKKLLLLAFVLVSISGYSQNNKFMMYLDTHPLNSDTQCRAAEKTTLEVANYLINNPINKKDNDQHYASNYVLVWMQQTPDYVFEFTDEAKHVYGSDKMLEGVYHAFLAKEVLMGSNKNTKSKSLRKAVLESLLDYIENPKNNVKKTLAMQKYINAKKMGKLDSVIY